MKRVSRFSWEETSRSSRRIQMRIAALSMAPVIFAQSFDPHDLGGIWSRNSQGYGGGGTCRGCGDRGFNSDVPPMTAWGRHVLRRTSLPMDVRWEALLPPN